MRERGCALDTRREVDKRLILSLIPQGPKRLLVGVLEIESTDVVRLGIEVAVQFTIPDHVEEPIARRGQEGAAR